MKVAAYEGIVDNGQVHFTTDVDLPDKTRVFVVVPDERSRPAPQILSPRLARPEQMSFFKKEVVEDPPDAEI